MTAGNNKESMKQVFNKYYLAKDEHGRIIETRRKLFYRVAIFIASAEELYGASQETIHQRALEFFQLMANNYFLPCTPVLMNAGKPRPMLSACFVLPVEDTIEGIFEAVNNTALIQRAGGGTGFNFGRLRPTGDKVLSSGGKTSGPIVFIGVFSSTTHAIQQGAFRRGANMGMLPIEHPDIVLFINVKNNPVALTNFNLSIAITDAFMEAILKKPYSPHIVVNPRNGNRYYIPKTINVNSYTIDDLIPSDRPANNCLTVTDLWNMIVYSAWATGEPGLVFIDRVNRDNPTPALGPIEATNPCGEQPLMPYECCTLGSINLSQLVKDDCTDLDWELFEKVITTATRFLDNCIDMNWYPLYAIREASKANRKIGLGVMGFADALIRLSIRYDSVEAEEFASRVSAFLSDTAHNASESLAAERGCFPNWEKSIWNTKETAE